MEFVLDLDLDFFVWPISHYQEGIQRLPDEECQNLFTEEQVRQFLEKRCSMSRNNKIPGQQIVEHEQAFRVWRRWLDEGKIVAPFGVVHVDAHADLGAGVNKTCYYVETDLLARPPQDRSDPPFGASALNSGNYLVFAIANRWIGHLTYVYPTEPILPDGRHSDAPGTLQLENLRRELINMTEDDYLPPPVGDLPPWCFPNGDWKTGVIRLVHRTRKDFLNPDSTPIHTEPSIPFEVQPYTEFEFSGFTHVLVAQSPQYTPVRADQLLPIIREYFEPA